MSAIQITINLAADVSENLRAIARGLQDKAPLHAMIAASAEAFVKARGAVTAATEHNTANNLGASPTGHLVDQYEAIEGQSTADGATLLVPSHGRLAAALAVTDPFLRTVTPFLAALSPLIAGPMGSASATAIAPLNVAPA